MKIIMKTYSKILIKILCQSIAYFNWMNINKNKNKNKKEQNQIINNNKIIKSILTIKIEQI